jgi:hypothetical protein
MNPSAVLLYIILFLSGFMGLGYEMVWTPMLSVGLGHEIVPFLAVVSAFFSGMAVGSFILDSPVSRSPHGEQPLHALVQANVDWGRYAAYRASCTMYLLIRHFF